MAKKQRPPPLEEPPTASSSSDEEEQQPSSQPQEDEVEASSGEEVEGSEEEDDEEDQPATLSQTASKNTPPTKSHTKPSSSSESESGSEAESESDEDVPSPPNPKVKPLASKPMDQNPKTKAQAQSSPVPTRSGTKRTVENNNNAHVSDSKRAKKKTTEIAPVANGGGSDDEMETEEDEKKSIDDSKKPPFQRVFSEDDEITILKALADFISNTGNDPVKYITVFHEYVKKSLQFDATSLQQLKQKVRRLKNKFKANAEKVKKNGEEPSFPKPHDQKLFELSKKVWGNEFNETAVENGKANNGKLPKSPKREASRKKAVTASAKKQPPIKKPLPETSEEPKKEPNSLVVMPLKESGKVGNDKDKVGGGGSSLILSEMFRFDNGVGLSGLNEDVVKKAVELMEESKRAELERRWKKLQVAELELFVKRAQLIEDQAKLILEVYKSSE